MSRTYRRKTAEWHRWSWCPKWKYHSDKQMTMMQVPSWYKTEFLRRPYRARARQHLRKALRDGTDPVMPIDKKAAQYYW